MASKPRDFWPDSLIDVSSDCTVISEVVTVGGAMLVLVILAALIFLLSVEFFALGEMVFVLVDESLLFLLFVEDSGEE